MLDQKESLNLSLNYEIKKALKSNTKLAILYIDLDNFKFINNILGYDFQNKLLLEIIQSFVTQKNSNTNLCRLGDDEFIILISNIENINYVTELCDKIIKYLHRYFIINEIPIYITTNIGIVIYPDNGSDIKTLFKNIHIAMYYAKSLGKNTYKLFSEELTDKIFKQINLEQNLESSLLNNKEKEFHVYYQPQINTHNRKLVGLEALVRWIHPKEGFIPPNRFIPIAEKIGLINEIDEFVIKTSCKQIKKWEEKNIKIVPVSVNISPNQFKNKNFFKKIKNILQKAELSPKYLNMEITESTAIDNISYTIKTLNKFKNMGIKLLLDDFGTGYSCLQYLKILPINTLKIDKSFIDEIVCNKSEQAITSFLINLAHNLNLDVIAEGVETEEQLSILKNQHCDKIQGYLFSKPLPADKVEFILKDED